MKFVVFTLLIALLSCSTTRNPASGERASEEQIRRAEELRPLMEMRH